MANRILIAATLALATAPAFALGLGQVQVKSQPGQPLLAEIPIISSDPAELQGLQVRLAPPETFARVGLQPPGGDVSSLRFEPALDAQGRPVIRVTSVAPLQQPLLTFLVEVDSNGVRVVREMTALVDAPRTVAAPAQPPIQAPVVAPSNAIVRPADTAPIQAPVVAAPPVAPVPSPISQRPVSPPVPAALPPPAAARPIGVVPAPVPVRPAPRPVATNPAPAVPAAKPVPPTPASAPKAAAQRPSLGQVQRGQTLSQIAAQLDGNGYSTDQTMLALLRSNPDAFIGNDINKLKAGAVLRTPDATSLSRYSASEASTLVREQIASWRQSRQAVVQPAAVATNPAKPRTPANKGTPTATAVRSTDARLEIASASGGAKPAGTRSGLEAGGEGDMVRQLQETKETLAARDAEVQELKTRVADLEKLQQQQQQLLTMKDSALAAAQRNLAAANRAPAATATVQSAASPPPTTQAAGPGGWLWLLGVAVLVLAALAWLWSRRRPRAVVARRGFDTAALAASIPQSESLQPVDAIVHAETDVDAGVDPDLDEQALAPAVMPAGSLVDDEIVANRDTPDASTNAGAPGADIPPAWTSGASVTPTWHNGSIAGHVAPTAADVANATQQLQLARAYLDMGDDGSARELLREVLDGRDPVARTEAARLLRDL